METKRTRDESIKHDVDCMKMGNPCRCAKVNHTPGPWDVWIHACDRKSFTPTMEYSINPDEHEYIPTRDEAMANASLIAAAPDLLKAAEFALKIWGKLPGSAQIGLPTQKVGDMLVAAIAKAKGQKAR